jgi:SAM-dependent methyltransferase
VPSSRAHFLESISIIIGFMNRRFLTEDALELSAAVANCRMNRDRGIVGSNSYAAELSLNPLDFLADRLANQQTVAWLDLCCGTGKALTQAARHFQRLGLADRVAIHGVDLVELFDPAAAESTCLILEAASLRQWTAKSECDLITCVHGLHYVGDKLGLIARAASWLKPDGLLLGHLDLANVKLTTGHWLRGQLGRQLKRNGLSHHPRRRLLSCQGKRRIEFPWAFAGADDTAGPNFTRQAAVDSYYSPPTAS